LFDLGLAPIFCKELLEEKIKYRLHPQVVRSYMR
jgi:hypothetical protein